MKEGTLCQVSCRGPSAAKWELSPAGRWRWQEDIDNGTPLIILGGARPWVPGDTMISYLYVLTPGGAGWMHLNDIQEVI